jgi:hypothetical protein
LLCILNRCQPVRGDKVTRYPWTETIAERTFEFHSAAGAVEPIQLTLGKPAMIPGAPDGDWYCPYRLASSGEVRESYAGGVDAVQAVLLALSKVWAELRHFPKSGIVLWLEEPDLGLQTIAPQPPLE